MDSNQPVSLGKETDVQYQQPQPNYNFEKDQIIQQQQMLIQQQQQQLQQLQNQQQYIQQPPQLQQMYVQPPQNTPDKVATINPSLEPSEIVNGVLHSPHGSEWYGSDMKGNLKIRVIRAYNLISADTTTGKSDPYVKIKSTCLAQFPQTKVITNNLNPIWEETLYVPIEGVRTELLMFKVYDHDTIGCDDLLGYFGVNLSLLPLGIEVVTKEKLYFAEHGTVEIGITAVDFGLTNLPTNYLTQYCEWRNNIQVFERKGFHDLPGSKKRSAFISTRIDMGPYQNKIVHDDFKIMHGYVKLRKNSREKFTDGLKTAGLITAVVGAAIITAPFTSCSSHNHW